MQQSRADVLFKCMLTVMEKKKKLRETTQAESTHPAWSGAEGILWTHSSLDTYWPSPSTTYTVEGKNVSIY